MTGGDAIRVFYFFVSNRWRRFRAQRRVHQVVQSLVAVFIMLGLGTFYLWRSQPSYWRDAQVFAHRYTPQQLRAMADSVQAEIGRLTTVAGDTSGVTPGGAAKTAKGDSSNTAPARRKEGGFFMTRPSEPRTITLDRDRLRAWVMTHLEAALNRSGRGLPRAMRQPVLDIQNGRFVLGFDYDTPEIHQVVSIYFRLAIEEDGLARVLLDGVTAGRLPIPIRSLAQHLRKNDSHPAAERVASLIDRIDHYRFDPVMSYDGQRNVRVLDIKIDRDEARFTVRFEPKKKKR